MIAGVGVNDATYTVQRFDRSSGKPKLTWSCPYYNRWKHMITRCYSERSLRKDPQYRDVQVCEEWLYFSNFKVWMEKQDWQGKHLDKDLLGDGKLYSPDSCVFIPQEINKFLTSQNRKASCLGLPVGVCEHKKINKYGAHVHNPFTGKREHLGVFYCEKEAHKAWHKRKLELSRELCSHFKLSEVLTKALMNFFKLEY